MTPLASPGGVDLRACGLCFLFVTRYRMESSAWKEEILLRISSFTLGLVVKCERTLYWNVSLSLLALNLGPSKSNRFLLSLESANKRQFA